LLANFFHAEGVGVGVSHEGGCHDDNRQHCAKFEPSRECHGPHVLYGGGNIAGTLLPIVTNCTEFCTIGTWESVKRVNGSYIRKLFTNKIMVIEYFVVVSIHGFHTSNNIFCNDITANHQFQNSGTYQNSCIILQIK